MITNDVDDAIRVENDGDRKSYDDDDDDNGDDDDVDDNVDVIRVEYDGDRKSENKNPKKSCNSADHLCLVLVNKQMNYGENIHLAYSSLRNIFSISSRCY